MKSLSESKALVREVIFSYIREKENKKEIGWTNEAKEFIKTINSKDIDTHDKLREALKNFTTNTLVHSAINFTGIGYLTGWQGNSDLKRNLEVQLIYIPTTEQYEAFIASKALKKEEEEAEEKMASDLEVRFKGALREYDHPDYDHPHHCMEKRAEKLEQSASSKESPQASAEPQASLNEDMSHLSLDAQKEVLEDSKKQPAKKSSKKTKKEGHKRAKRTHSHRTHDQETAPQRPAPIIFQRGTRPTEPIIYAADNGHDGDFPQKFGLVAALNHTLHPRPKTIDPLERIGRAFLNFFDSDSESFEEEKSSSQKPFRKNKPEQ